MLWRINITGTTASSGKTTLANALYAMLRQSGIPVKFGPNPTPKPPHTQNRIEIVEHNSHNNIMTSTLNTKKNRGEKEISNTTFLIADSGKGNIAAIVYGTIALMPPTLKKTLAGIILNTWRPEYGQYHEIAQHIQALTGIPVIATIPLFTPSFLETGTHHSTPPPEPPEKLDALILDAPGADLREPAALEQQHAFAPRLAGHHTQIHNFDILIIPHVDNIENTLRWLKYTGIDTALRLAIQKKEPVAAIGNGGVLLAQLLHGQIPPPAPPIPRTTTTTPLAGRINRVTGTFSCLANLEFNARITSPLTFSHNHTPSFASILSPNSTTHEGIVTGNSLITAMRDLLYAKIIRTKLAEELLSRKGSPPPTRHETTTDNIDPLATALEKVRKLLPDGIFTKD